MQCVNCGKILPGGSRFCPYCGFAPVFQQASALPAATSQEAALRAAAAAGRGPAQTAFVLQASGSLSPANPPPRKRRGRSMGWIVFYAFMAILLLFTGLGVALHEIGSHVLGGLNAQYNARQAAAMQLYQEVRSQHPSVQDSLQDPSQSGWENDQQTDYGCALSSAGLRAYISLNSRLEYCLDQAAVYDDFAFQVQMQVLSGDAGGLVFRVASGESRMYVLQVTASGRYALFLDKDTNVGTFSSLASGTTSAMNGLTGGENTLMLIARGNTFDVFINQQFVPEGHDAAISSGRIGVLAVDDSSPTQVVYRDATIWQLS
jgi:hypothetical protein